MTTLGKTLFAIAAVGVLVCGGLSVRAAHHEPVRPPAQLTPAQRTELFKPEPQQPKLAPAIHFDPPPFEAPEDGAGS